MTETKKAPNQIVRLALILFVVSALTSGVLGLVNYFTKDIIAQRQAEARAEAYQAVLPYDGEYETVAFDEAAWETVDAISKAGDEGWVVELTFSGAQSSITAAFGVGSDYNENLMTALAQNSDGNFYFVENSRDLSLIFEKELGSALAVAAKDVRLRIVCPPGITPKGILGHECRIHGQEIELDFNQIYAGHSKVLILQLGLPAAENGAEKTIASVKMDYLDNALKKEFSANRSVHLAFASDQSKVKGSLNKAVSADVALQQSALLREQALAEADKGNFSSSRKIMESAGTLLRKNAAITNAPAVQKEADIAAEEIRKLEKAKSAPSSYSRVRKEIIGNSFQIRNSQLFKQK